MDHPNPTQRKLELRALARARRRSVAASDRADFDQRIGTHLLQELELRKPGCVSAFLAFDGEPDLRPMLHRLCASGVRVALPVLACAAGETSIHMHEWRPGASLRNNAFGIQEPDGGNPVPLDQIDIILLPLVAWDRSGTRLGMGGGHYDRLLHSCAGLGRPLRAGVAYSVQELPGLPRQNWDILLHAIVTEEGWFSLPC